MYDLTMCPCCGEHRFTEKDYYECCPVCGWIDDAVQRNNPDYPGGANKLSLNEFKASWECTRKTA